MNFENKNSVFVISQNDLFNLLTDNELQDCYDDCKDKYTTGSKELKACIFDCIYPEDY